MPFLFKQGFLRRDIGAGRQQVRFNTANRQWRHSGHFFRNLSIQCARHTAGQYCQTVADFLVFLSPCRFFKLQLLLRHFQSVQCIGRSQLRFNALLHQFQCFIRQLYARIQQRQLFCRHLPRKILGGNGVSQLSADVLRLIHRRLAFSQNGLNLLSVFTPKVKNQAALQGCVRQNQCMVGIDHTGLRFGWNISTQTCNTQADLRFVCGPYNAQLRLSLLKPCFDDTQIGRCLNGRSNQIV